MTPEPDPDLDCEDVTALRLVWNGNMVDVFPAGDASVSDMLECDLGGPIHDIREANDTSRFEDDEHLGFAYFESESEYDLRVA